MAAAQLGTLVRGIHLLAADRRAGGGTDRQLLDDFARRRDETAFGLLVVRHGPMVLRVCRRVLRHEQDAEDAFQATFLVLARRAGAIRRRETLSAWLHGVAYRTALVARRGAARRRFHEARLGDRPPAGPPAGDDVRAVLDEEVGRLPESFREVFVRCVLNGQTVAAAAAELGIREGTVASRLARSRQRLRRQLVRGGIQLSAVLAATSCAEGARLPAGLAARAAGNAGPTPPHVAALAAETVKGLAKARVGAALALAACLLAAGVTVVASHRQAEPRAEADGARPAAAAGGQFPGLRSVAGVVRDTDTGEPVRGAVITVPGERAVRPAVTDREGRYLLAGLSRREDYVILARPPEGQPYLAAVCGRHDAPGRGPVAADFNLKRGVWITGRVTDRATGKPVRARVEYSPFAGNPFGAEVLPAAAGNAPCLSRVEDGSFRLVGLRGRGLVCVRAVAGDYRQGAGADKIDVPRPGGDFPTCPPVSAADFHALVAVNLAEGDAPPACEVVLEPGP